MNRNPISTNSNSVAPFTNFCWIRDVHCTGKRAHLYRTTCTSQIYKFVSKQPRAVSLQAGSGKQLNGVASHFRTNFRVWPTNICELHVWLCGGSSGKCWDNWGESCEVCRAPFHRRPDFSLAASKYAHEC